ncbi:hypothetical protein MUO79_11340 [Candidatus Bathyarchaeota archaeon]|nr:hypothetical protein [Candidatus Bathyarchaeota archaeon]
MEKAVPKLSLGSFGSVSTILYIPLGGILTPEAIQVATKLGISVDTINHSGAPQRLLDPHTVKQTFQANKAEARAIQHQKASGWLIPHVLIKELQGLQNLEYSDRLRQFALDFFNLPTPVRISTQYKLACQCVEDIFKSTYDVGQCCESLRTSRDLEKMARLKGETRDHFLHEFQTFLMGAIVLDKLGSNSSPFVLSRRHPRADLSWLIASIFHDYGFDLVNLESCIPGSISEFRYIPLVNTHYPPLLNSLYEFRKNGGDVDDWNPNVYPVQSNILENILFNAAIEKSLSASERIRANHGVISAYEIIRHAHLLAKCKPYTYPVFITSALSASLHDKKIWKKLFSGAIFPIDATRFPILYLLVLCDTIAEGGRPKTTNVKQQDAVLANFQVRNNSIYCGVWFAESENAYVMNFWSQFIQKACFTNGFLRLNCKSLVL